MASPQPQRGIGASTVTSAPACEFITSTERRGLRRLFDAAVLERLTLIGLGRRAGFALEEIARMFAPDGRLNIDRKLLANKADELDGRIRELTAMRNGLRHAAACPARSHMECPTFPVSCAQRAAARSTEARRRRKRLPHADYVRAS